MTLFAAGCTLGNGTSQTASNTPVPPSPSLLPASTPSAAASPSAQPSASAPAANGLTVASIPTHNGEVGVIYLAVTLQATGGTAPYSWTATGMPPGLSVSPQGVVTGNNTKAGKYSFTAQVTDSTGATATGTQTMTVFPPLAVSQPCATACYVGLGCSTCGRFGGLSGGAGPYHYKVVGGAVPPGMTLNGFLLNGAWPFPNQTITVLPVDALTTGPISRFFPWNLAVQVTDDFGVNKTVNANWFEFGPLTLGTAAATCSGNPSCSNSSITYFGGSPVGPVSVRLTRVCDLTDTTCETGAAIAGALPPAWSATVNSNGTVTVAFDCGTTSCSTGGFQADIFFELVDNGACVASLTTGEAKVTINWAP